MIKTYITELPLYVEESTLRTAYCTADSAKYSTFITKREIEKTDEKVKQVLDASDRNSCSVKLTPQCKYNAYTAEQRAQLYWEICCTYVAICSCSIDTCLDYITKNA